MISTARRWIGRLSAGRTSPDPILEAIRDHQLAAVRLEAAVTACAELNTHVLSVGLRAEECGLPVLEAWRYRMEWAAYYALQCMLSTVPTTTAGARVLKAYLRKQFEQTEAKANHPSPSLPLLRTREVLARFLDREA